MKLVQRIYCSLNSAWKAARISWATVRREYLIEQYLRAGSQFGDAVSKLHTGECVDLQSARRHWDYYERQYARLGFRTIAAEEFLEYGAFGKSIDSLLRVVRNPDEQPVLHADRFKRFNQDDFAALQEFAGPRSDASRCGLGDAADSAEVAGPDSCNLPDCRLQDEKAKQEAGRRWRF